MCSCNSVFSFEMGVFLLYDYLCVPQRLWNQRTTLETLLSYPIMTTSHLPTPAPSQDRRVCVCSF